MADPNTRQGKRTPVTLKIKFKSETIEQFIERYAVDVSQGGIFIRTKEPLAVGTQMKFEFQLRDASPLISGEGTVVWTRENDPSRPAIAPGMGVRFDRLNDGSQTVLERILAEKAKQAPQRGGVGAGDQPTKPLFTDTPTKVAPAPVQEALGVRRTRADSEQTPLPKPMPFHSDADDFDERAFEEATKVRALEELAAQSALAEGDENDDTKTDNAMPRDELAARRGRADSDVDSPAPDPAAPTLPAMPEGDPSGGRQPRLLDTTPSPRNADRPPDELMGRTKLGVEPARAMRASDSGMARAAVLETSQPVRVKRSSSAPLVIGLLVLLAAGAGAVWWFVLREEVADNTVAKKPDLGSGSATPVGSGSGSQVATTHVGSGSAVVEKPKGPMVDTVIASNITKGATVEIVGTDQKGPAPFTAKLEKDKAYKARVMAPGYAALEMDIKGGQDKATAKLVAKPHVISVASDPPGGDIYIDGSNTKQLTPADIELTASQAAKAKVRVAVKRTGYRAMDQVVEASTFKDEDTKMTAKVAVKLQKASSAGTGGGTHTPTGSGGTGAGSGSAKPPEGSGAGSATKPPEGSGAGSATKPPEGGGGAGGGSATKPPAGSGASTPAPAGRSPDSAPAQTP